MRPALRKAVQHCASEHITCANGVDSLDSDRVNFNQLAAIIDQRAFGATGDGEFLRDCL